MIKLTYSLLLSLKRNRITKYNMATNKLDKLIAEIAEKIGQQPIIKNNLEEQILKNYLELTEQSYLEHFLEQQKISQAQRKKIDPRLILMIIPTLQKKESKRQHLLLMYPYLNFLNIKELQLFYEHLLAQKINTKPKVPTPKNLIGGEALLTFLAQIHPKDSLIEWLGQVPLYQGQQVYLIAMGAFSIISQLSESARPKNEVIIKRSLQRIFQLWYGSNSEVRLGVILLALQAKLSFGEYLLLQDYSLQLQQIDGLKLGLLLIQLNNYVQTQYHGVKSAGGPKSQQEDQQEVDISEGIDKIPAKTKKPVNQKYVYNPSKPQQVKYQLEKWLNKILHNYQKQQWNGVMKLHQLVKFFNIIQSKPFEKQWLRFANKLFDFTSKKQQATSLINLSTEQIIQIVQCLEKHKVNKPDLLKQLLIALSDRLEMAEANQMIRLAKCLITYVRLCEDYLIHFRKILQRRKYIFSPQEIDALNFHFRRVQILFPKPLLY